MEIFKGVVQRLRLLDLDEAESIRPMLVSFDEFIRLVFDKHFGPFIFKTLKEINRPYYWIFMFYPSSQDRLEQKNMGFYVRDATFETDLEFIFMKNEQKMVMRKKKQLSSVEYDKRGELRKRNINRA